MVAGENADARDLGTDGRKFTLEDFVTLMNWHDDNHLDQLNRALEGRV